ncbi:MAG: hypothetical protein GX800_11150 [Clostridiaceae bacterium]|nr:hypothetical protein [Clostridiaceae bacterium]
MKRELELKITEEFPFMRRGKNIDEQRKEVGHISDLYGAFGCGVGDGWYEVIRGLCRDITEAYTKAGLPVDIIVDQVKEKFGTLRFYYHPEAHDPGIHAFVSVSDGKSIRIMPGISELHKEVAEIVQKWEKESSNVCEKCGIAGDLRKDLSWVLTLCDSCYARLSKK